MKQLFSMYNQITSNKRRSILLMTLFIIIILGLGYTLGITFGYGYDGLIIAVVISIFMGFTSYFAGDKIALLTTGAKAIIKEDNPYVYRLVENLCITAGLPLPKIYIIEDPSPNAFATGRDPQHASLALTTGIIAMLKNEELEGVIAHELSHIKNYDIRLMMIVGVLLGVIVILSDFLLRGRFLFGGRSSNDRGGNSAQAVLLIVGIILAILSPFIAQLIHLAISRRREFLADASGALLTRYPDGLASALEKISTVNLPMKNASNGTAHLFIVNPFGKTKKFLSNAFSTHPPIEERIKVLRGMTL